VGQKGLFVKKPLKVATSEEPQELHPHLGWFHLIAIGIGAIIGGGIFVITGQAAADYAGPSIVVSFIIASLICVFAGLCILELSSVIPMTGGSYTHSYVVMGEFAAWIVGWVSTIQYLVSASTVAVGWSGYFKSVLKDFGIVLSDVYSHAPIVLDPTTGWGWSGAVINLPAIGIVLLTICFIGIGIKAATHFNHTMVFLKLGAIFLFIFLGLPYIQESNLIPFIPPNTGTFGQFGWSGLVRGAGFVFFAFVGFDTVSNLSTDAKNPQKDLPRGILGSLIICTLIYLITAFVLTGVVSYPELHAPDPIAVALNTLHVKVYWLSLAIKLAILAGLASVVLVQLLGQTRIFYSIGKDGLLPYSFCRVHKGRKTPLFSTFVTGIVAVLISGLFPVDILGELVSISTLFLFVLICLGVLILRYTHPEYERPFKVPFMPYIPILGILACSIQMGFLRLSAWVQLILWLILGIVIYFGYGYRNSKLRAGKSG